MVQTIIVKGAKPLREGHQGVLPQTPRGFAGHSRLTYSWYSSEPCTHRNDWMSIMSRGRRSRRSRRTAAANSSRLAYVSQEGRDSYRNSNPYSRARGARDGRLQEDVCGRLCDEAEDGHERPGEDARRERLGRGAARAFTRGQWHPSRAISTQGASCHFSRADGLAGCQDPSKTLARLRSRAALRVTLAAVARLAPHYLSTDARGGSLFVAATRGRRPI
jgi:hypothetical protein